MKSAVLHAIELAHYAIVYARAWAADSINARVRLAAENNRLHEECALRRERAPRQGFAHRANYASATPTLPRPRSHGDPRAARRPRLATQTNRRYILSDLGHHCIVDETH